MKRKQLLLQAEDELKEYFVKIVHIGCTFYCEEMHTHKAYSDIIKSLHRKLQLPIQLIVRRNSELFFYGKEATAQALYNGFPQPLGQPRKDLDLWVWSGEIPADITWEDIIDIII
ncbi:hypothetical protein [Xylanibacter rodentium]|uniref:hypothetical protein n=1 Tax=Xylanibacter rodentium TaxID=2736289 RepID=UPI00259CD154|nr:hypothetical protein [Xylanibacter rodentium]MCX4349814.1 hypothetical protein [Alphaproteobacteria bacterium]